MKIAGRFAIGLFALLVAAPHSGRAGEPASNGTAGRESSATLRDPNQPLELPGLDGRPERPFQDRHGQPIVFLFICTDCPVANRYAPEIERLYETYGKRVAFRLVYADRRDGVEKIRRHLAEYHYKLAPLRDPNHRLVKRCGATKTPEAVLFSAEGKEIYRGRIDDRFTDYGKSRNEPSHRDLEEAIEAVLAGRPVKVANTKVVGCFIPDVEP